MAANGDLRSSEKKSSNNGDDLPIFNGENLQSNMRSIYYSRSCSSGRGSPAPGTLSARTAAPSCASLTSSGSAGSSLPQTPAAPSDSSGAAGISACTRSSSASALLFLQRRSLSNSPLDAIPTPLLSPPSSPPLPLAAPSPPPLPRSCIPSTSISSATAPAHTTSTSTTSPTATPFTSEHLRQRLPPPQQLILRNAGKLRSLCRNGTSTSSG